jgi:hypothetical protein
MSIRSHKSHFAADFDDIGRHFDAARDGGRYVIDRIVMGSGDFERLKSVDSGIMDLDGDGSATLWGARINPLGADGLLVFLGKANEEVLSG